jgi:hypothetical protein
MMRSLDYARDDTRERCGEEILQPHFVPFRITPCGGLGIWLGGYEYKEERGV